MKILVNPMRHARFCPGERSLQVLRQIIDFFDPGKRRLKKHYCARVCYALFAAALAWTQIASAQVTCTIAQITDTADMPPILGNRAPSINRDGSRIAFASGFDLTGGNPDGSQEIFLFAAGSIIQVTDTAGSFDSNRNPSINANGTRIAFSSDRNITGGNPDLNRELFLFDSPSGTFTQITNTTGGAADTNNLPSIDDSGTRIAFISDRNLTGGNGDLNFEIFLVDTAANVLEQVTNSVGVLSVDPAVDAQARRIALASTGNLTGENADTNPEVFLFDTMTGLFTQLSNAVGGFSGSPSISDAGTGVAFVSQGNLTGGNPDNNAEVFLSNPGSGALRQITDTPGGPMGFIHDNPVIDGSGRRIAFERTQVPGFPDLILFDATRGTLTEIAAGPVTSPSINRDGTRVAFAAMSDLTGGNPDGNQEIFLAACPRPAVAPTLSRSGLFLTIVALALSGLASLRGRGLKRSNPGRARPNSPRTALQFS